MVKFKFPKIPIRFLLIAVICLLVSSQVLADQKDQEGETVLKAPKDQEDETVYPVPPPLVYQGLFPCQACHRKDSRGVSSQVDRGQSFLGKFLRAPDPRPRILVRMHRDINLQHADWQWCLDCHNTDERNYLRLINGDTIPFEKSYRLCGQCHGLIYRDWKLGIHGRRVGQWNGKKLYLLCAHCHDPHIPKFRKLMSQDPPRPPTYGRWESKDKLKDSHAD
jgi:hypothetical protein